MNSNSVCYEYHRTKFFFWDLMLMTFCLPALDMAYSMTLDPAKGSALDVSAVLCPAALEMAYSTKVDPV